MTIENHTEIEKEIITDFGGTPTESFGADGTLNDAPVEVRTAAEDDRFRINKETHQDLMENDGHYIFDEVTDDKPPNKVDAETVDERLSDDFHSDRGFMHQFIQVDSMI
jgi:hypothetical protein